MWSRHNCPVIVTSSASDCDVISRTKTERVRHGDDVIVDFIVMYGFVMSCKKKMMHVLPWRIVSVPTRVLFLCLFPSLLRTSGNKHKNNLSCALKQFVPPAHALCSTFPAVLQFIPTNIHVVYDLSYFISVWCLTISFISFIATYVVPVRNASNIVLWPLLLTWFNFNPSMDK